MKRLTIVVSALLSMACNNSDPTKHNTENATTLSYKSLEAAAWLLGTWHDEPKLSSPREVPRALTEIWNRENDSTYRGESFVVSAGDTVFYESVQLQQRGNDIHYVVSIKGQSGEAPVSFKLTSIDTSNLVFENPTHDFPSKITYTRITQDSLYAEISGMANGQQRKEGFPFKKKTR